MRFLFTSSIAVLLFAAPAVAQTPPDGAAVFKQSCATCHTAAPADRAPSDRALREMSADAIRTALTTGPMRAQGQALSDAQREAVATFLGGTSTVTGATANACTTVPAVTDPEAAPIWNGWGADIRNSRFQPANRARLTAADVPRLKLKWAFGFPVVRAKRSQTTVAGSRLFVSGGNNEVYALDPRTGCQYWVFRAKSNVRAAVVVALYSGDGASGPYAAYFGDSNANFYAVDVLTGKQLWTRRIDDQSEAAVMAAAVYHFGRLYVGVTSLGVEGQGANPKYECCRFRGSVTALDASNGNQVWKTFPVQTVPTPRGKNSVGTQLWGPSGGAVWSTPTVDSDRRVLYVGTGNGYSDPPQDNQSAVLALDLMTGAVKWSFQPIKGDVWVIGCPEQAAAGNCPAVSGPDFDFGSSPILATVPGGRQLVIAGQKSGVAWALDPDKQGAVVWQYRAGKGGLGGGIQWGSAVDRERAYFAVSDASNGPEASGGFHAVNLATGARAWYTPPPPPACGQLGPQCHGAQSAAVTAIDGVVFSGASDGGMRAFDSATGKIVWEFNTNRDFTTVNGVKASGGSIDGAGPVVVNGMVFFNSGYTFGRGGNVLLAFGPE